MSYREFNIYIVLCDKVKYDKSKDCQKWMRSYIENKEWDETYDVL